MHAQGRSIRELRGVLRLRRRDDPPSAEERLAVTAHLLLAQRIARCRQREVTELIVGSDEIEAARALCGASPVVVGKPGPLFANLLRVYEEQLNAQFGAKRRRR